MAETNHSTRSLQLTAEQRRALHTAALRYCHGDRATADDLVQDACVRAWRSIDSLHDSTRLLSWLLRILHNVWIDVTRRQTYIVPVAELPEQSMTTESPSAWQRVTIDDVQEALGQLAEPYRSVAILQYLENLSNAEISQRLRIPYATAATRLRRARQQLRALLDAQLDGDDAASPL